MFSVSLTPAGGMLTARRPDRDGQRLNVAKERCLSSSRREALPSEGVTVVTGMAVNGKSINDLDHHTAVLTLDQQHIHDHHKANEARQEAGELSQPIEAHGDSTSPSQIPGDAAFSPAPATSSVEVPATDTSASVKLVAADQSSSKAPSRRPTSRRLLGRIGAAIRRSPKQRGKRRAGSQSEGVEVAGYSIVTKGLTHDLFWAFGRWLYGFWLAQHTEGIENLPLHRGTFLMASNHSSHLDCGATFMAAWAGGANDVFALGARDYFFKSPLFAHFVTSYMHVMPINRKGITQQEVDALLQVKARSSPDRPAAVLIFPEGTRSTTGSLQSFKTGVALLAEQLDVPVVPVCVKGTLDALPKGRLIPFRSRVRVQFGKPLEMRDYLAAAEADLAAREDQIFQDRTTPAARNNPDCLTSSPTAEARAVDSRETEVGKGAAEGAAGNASPSQSPSPTTHSEEDVMREVRRAALRKFSDDLRSSVSAMLGSYGSGRREAPRQIRTDHSSIAERLGGGIKWHVMGWLLFWLPVVGLVTAAVAMAVAQGLRIGAPVKHFATVAAVFGGLTRPDGAKTLLLLALVLAALLMRYLVQFMWPYVVLSVRED